MTDGWKGIVLAGGQGTRLYPMTGACSKQLLPVFDKPMVYYPLTTLVLGGIVDILLISTPRDLPSFKSLLGDGSSLGVNLSYAEQAEPRGIAEAFLIGKEFIGGDNVCLILGDNLFTGHAGFLHDVVERNRGATVFGYSVHDPGRYGVIGFDENGKAESIEEKPANPRSNVAVTGLYCYDNRVIAMAERLEPSGRNELEITDLNRLYLDNDELDVRLLDDDVTWLDVGTPESLQEAGELVKAMEHRQGRKIGCPEAAAMKMGYIDGTRLTEIAENMPDTEYRTYLLRVAGGNGRD